MREPLSIQARFWIAAQEGNIENLRELLAAGAEINSFEIYGKTALWIAAYNSHVAAVQFLLSVPGVDIHSPARQRIERLGEEGRGPKPIFMAASHEHSDMIEVLAGAKADLNPWAYNAYSATPLRIAVNNGHSDAVRSLLHAKAWVNQAYPPTLLCASAVRGFDGIVRQLLQAKASVDEGNHAPLLAAARNDNTNVVAQLLEAKASVDKGNHAPLLEAARSGNSNVVAQLLRAKAEVNRVSSDHETALYEAALNGHTNVVGRLLLAKAAIDQSDKMGRTPLLNAIQRGHDALAIRLLQAKAAVNLADNNGYSPLAAAARSADLITYLLGVKAAIDHTNNNGETPLWRASFYAENNAVICLLNAKASIHQADNLGKTPLLAIGNSLFMRRTPTQRNKQKVVANTLLDHGAEVPENQDGLPDVLLEVLAERRPDYSNLLAKLYNIAKEHSSGGKWGEVPATMNEIEEKIRLKPNSRTAKIAAFIQASLSSAEPLAVHTPWLGSLRVDIFNIGSCKKAFEKAMRDYKRTTNPEQDSAGARAATP